MRGGARPGAGRKKGSLTKRSREIAERAAAAGMTPLDVLLLVMQKAIERQDWSEAAKCARDAAPYMHPRLAAVDATGHTLGSIVFVQVDRFDLET
jgi:hypothetical protein